MKDIAEFQQCADRLKAVADPDRLRILDCLFRGPVTVGELSQMLGEEIVKVSHHLAVLRKAKVVLDTRKGRFVEYSLHPDVSLTPSPKPEGRMIELGCCRVELTDIR